MANQTPEHSAAHPPIATDPVTQTLALLQPWINYVPQRQRRLGLFIFLALLVHVAVFFFIRIDTTRAELQRPARTHVTMDMTQPVSREAASGDTFWDRLTDPRLFLLPLEPLTGLSPNEAPLDFTAINSSIGSLQLPAPVPAEGYQFVHQTILPLEQRVESAMAPPRQPFVYDETPPAIATKTTCLWDPALTQRQPSSAPDLPSPVSDTELTPTELRVAVNPGGAVEHVLLEQSCGSGRLDLDQQAILAVRKIRFHSTDQPGLVWGRIIIFWRYAAKPREDVQATPPSST